MTTTTAAKKSTTTRKPRAPRKPSAKVIAPVKDTVTAVDGQEEHIDDIAAEVAEIVEASKVIAKRVPAHLRSKRAKFTYNLRTGDKVVAQGSREDDGSRYWWTFTHEGDTFAGEWTKDGVTIAGTKYDRKVSVREALIAHLAK